MSAEVEIVCGVITHASDGVRVRCARSDDPSGHRGPHWQVTQPLLEGCSCPDPICFCEGSIGHVMLEDGRRRDDRRHGLERTGSSS